MWAAWHSSNRGCFFKNRYYEWFRWILNRLQEFTEKAFVSLSKLSPAFID